MEEKENAVVDDTMETTGDTVEEAVEETVDNEEIDENAVVSGEEEAPSDIDGEYVKIGSANVDEEAGFEDVQAGIDIDDIFGPSDDDFGSAVGKKPCENNDKFVVSTLSCGFCTEAATCPKFKKAMLKRRKNQPLTIKDVMLITARVAIFMAFVILVFCLGMDVGKNGWDAVFGGFLF